MNTHALEVLEYGEVLRLVAGFASSEVTSERIAAFQPEKRLALVEAAFREVAEYLVLLEETSQPPRPRVTDIMPILGKTRVQGIAAAPEELLRIAGLLEHSREVRDYFHKRHDAFPAIHAISEQLAVVRSLEFGIKAAVDEHAMVRDDASPQLAKIRHSQRRLTDQIRTKVYSLVKRYSGTEVLQDQVATLRNNRLVIPVKIEERRRIKGIIHDQSSSGATLFIEPQETVNMNNALVSLQSSEKAEEHRILLGLTDILRVHREMLAAGFEALVHLDIIHCKAAFAKVYHGRIPKVVERGRLELRLARHPLLLARQRHVAEGDRREVVPLDIELDPSRPAVVISGPNAGGKTVALKTVGLLVLLAQSGIPITAQGDSVIPMFSRIFADIGDEQSIEASLSTFSAHILNIKRVLDGAHESSLVLLDELGAGTDPDQGGVLGIAILEELLRRRTITVATTHHDRIKGFAQLRDDIVNACMDFDEQELSPTYHLNVGKVGKSYTFLVAEGLGFPRQLVRRACELLDRSDLDREELINALQNQRHELDESMERLRGKEVDADKLLERRSRALEEARIQGERELARLRQEALELHRRFRVAFEELLARAKSDRITQQTRQEFKELLNVSRHAIEDQLPAVEPPVVQEGRIVPAALVWIAPLRSQGRVESIAGNGETVQVMVGGKRITAAAADLKILESPPDKRMERVVTVNTDSLEEVQALPSRLHLLGYRVPEAERAMERYLDLAYRNRYPEVTIVHGFGTGRLHKAVIKFLEKHPHVAGQRTGDPSEGGGGVTVVTLAL
ncbi:endonuclease MutS2 [bacterium]|nr:endonuclease MutS2 [candidate division CSSED10-310 bacterium]